MKDPHMDLIKTLENEEIARLAKTIPSFAPGDTVIVSVNVVEGTRKRVQAYEGVVIAKRNRGLNSSFIVRKISSGEGVERCITCVTAAVRALASKKNSHAVLQQLLDFQHLQATTANAQAWRFFLGSFTLNLFTP
jgi:large subunit ribosomal protein L19